MIEEFATDEDFVIDEEWSYSETTNDDRDDPSVVTAKAELEAIQIELAQAQEGYEFYLDVSKKMGMVVNPDLTVSKVVEGGQADSNGVRPGCQVTWVGGYEVTSLEDLKGAISSAKVSGESSVAMYYSDPRRLTRAKAKEAKLKAAVSSAVAKAAAKEAEQAQLRADAEAETARAVVEANAQAKKEAEDEAHRLFEENELARQLAKEEADAVLVATELARAVAEQKAKEIAEANERARAAAEAQARELEAQRRKVMEEAKAAAQERLRLEAEALANEELNRKIRERRAGSASVQLSILGARCVLARDGDASGFSDVYAVAEMVDLLTNRPVDSDGKLVPHRTRTVKRTVDPFWLERVNWADVPLPPSSLGVRVKLFDKEKWSATPLGQATLPLLAPGTSPEEEEEAGALLDRDIWYAIGPSPKMKAAPTGEIQLRVAWNEYRLFDCEVCGKFNSKEAKNFCRCCGAKARRKPNSAISKDDGKAQRLHRIWVKRRVEKFEIKREPLPPPPTELQLTDESSL